MPVLLQPMMPLFRAGVDVSVASRQKARVPRHLEVVRSTPDDFAQLFQANADALRMVARRLCGNATEAEDLVQDALERALAAKHTFSPGTNARAWLMSILHNLFIDRCRRRAREGVAVPVEALEHQLSTPDAEEEPRWAKLSRADVDVAVSHLEPGFREVYRLHVDGRSYEQISQALSIPRATVGTRLLRARKKLKSLLFGDDEKQASP